MNMITASAPPVESRVGHREHARDRAEPVCV